PLALPVCCTRYHPDLRSFPTRRSSDLLILDALRATVRGSELDLSLPDGLSGWVSAPHGVTSQVRQTHPDTVELMCTARLDPLGRSEEHTSELQSRFDLVCRLLLEKKTK